MDITFDRLVELAIIISLALLYPEYIFYLLILTAGIVYSMTVFLTVGALSERVGMKSFYYQAGIAERTEGFIFLTAMMVAPFFSMQAFMIITIIFIVIEWFTGTQRLLEARKIFKK